MTKHKKYICADCRKRKYQKDMYNKYICYSCYAQEVKEDDNDPIK
jgi:hypothetical protein